ncbi:hypothetical protein NN561_003737 [Cricetulus griseus]
MRLPSNRSLDIPARVGEGNGDNQLPLCTPAPVSFESQHEEKEVLAFLPPNRWELKSRASSRCRPTPARKAVVTAGHPVPVPLPAVLGGSAPGPNGLQVPEPESCTPLCPTNSHSANPSHEKCSVCCASRAKAESRTQPRSSAAHHRLSQVKSPRSRMPPGHPVCTDNDKCVKLLHSEQNCRERMMPGISGFDYLTHPSQPL